ncbi:MAG: peptidylprolyl isomerase [Bacteroidales bacterium]|nr:peptidylprolyl isomerase [Bacteroidales bacterium]
MRTIRDLPEEPVFDISTSMGTIRVKLYKDTPKHRDNFIRLAISHFYDGTLFHRVVPGFVIQGGDPYTKDTTRVEEWGEGGPGYNIDPEFVPEHRHKKGALAAARRGDFANPAKESSGSQFYLVQDSTACSHLNGEYTVFGETVGGLNVIDRIARVRTDRFDRPLKPVIIHRITPNMQMNKRAKEEELRRAEGLPSEDLPAVETEPQIQLADSAALKDVLKGRTLKKRDSKKK